MHFDASFKELIVAHSILDQQLSLVPGEGPLWLANDVNSLIPGADILI